jgi:hypothetical protein
MLKERVGDDKNFSPASRTAFLNLREFRNSAAHYLHEEDSPVLIKYKLRLIFNEFSGISAACRRKLKKFGSGTDFVDELRSFLEEKVKELPPY